MPKPLPRISKRSLDRLKGKRIVGSISGGKDSAAVALYLMEHGLEFDRVFADTGWEHKLTYAYLKGELPAKIGPITWLKGKYTMQEIIRVKAMFPSRMIRFCTQELKVYPIIEYVKSLQDAGFEVANAVGIRHEESDERSKLFEWEWSSGFDCEVFRPLIEWKLQDVIDIHARHGLKPNPLYLMGASRVGCWPCIYARKAEVRFVADTDPGRIDEIRELEREVSRGAVERAIRNDRVLTCLPSFFAARDKKGADRRWDIDRIVEWSRSNEPEVVDYADSGCMKWGVCSTHSEPESAPLVQLKAETPADD